MLRAPAGQGRCLPDPGRHLRLIELVVLADIKVAHFLVYCAITALLWFGTGGRMPIAVVTIAVAIGTFDELHQGTLPGRIADGWDFLTGLCAAALTVFSLLLLFGASAARRNARITP